MAKKKQPDYKKAAEEASAALTEMKIKRGKLHGSPLGSGDRTEAIARFRRWVEIAAEHLSTEWIDQACFKIPLALNVEAMASGDERGAWIWKWEAELMADKQAHGQVQ
jgi:hypothetical protein